MIACARCGRVADDDPPPVTWMVDHDDRGRRTVVCPACVREHVRAIEAKLDQTWW